MKLLIIIALLITVLIIIRKKNDYSPIQLKEVDLCGEQELLENIREHQSDGLEEE